MKRIAITVLLLLCAVVATPAASLLITQAKGGLESYSALARNTNAMVEANADNTKKLDRVMAKLAQVREQNSALQIQLNELQDLPTQIASVETMQSLQNQRLDRLENALGEKSNNTERLQAFDSKVEELLTEVAKLGHKLFGVTDSRADGAIAQLASQINALRGEDETVHGEDEPILTLADQHERLVAIETKLSLISSNLDNRTETHGTLMDKLIAQLRSIATASTPIRFTMPDGKVITIVDVQVLEYNGHPMLVIFVLEDGKYSFKTFWVLPISKRAEMTKNTLQTYNFFYN